MTTITCTKCGGEAEAKTKKAKYCDPCRTPGEHKNSTANILARKAERDAKQKIALRQQAAKNKVTAEKTRTMPFFDDADELDWLIKEQERDDRATRLSNVYLGAIDWEGHSASILVDNSFEEGLDALLDRV